MDFPDHRPRFSDFQKRTGMEFLASEINGQSQTRWKLTQCEALPKPPIEELADQDCFWLSFEVRDGPRLQGLYRLESEDGFEVTLTASPYLQHCMQVTVN